MKTIQSLVIVIISLFAINVFSLEYKCYKPEDGFLPLSMYNVAVGSTKEIRFDLPEISSDDAVYLFLEMVDVDKLSEIRIMLNQVILNIPKTIINDGDSAYAYFLIDHNIIHPGNNIMSFVFMSTLNGTTRGYHVKKASFLVTNKKDKQALVSMLDKKYSKCTHLRNENSEQYYVYNTDFSKANAGQVPEYWMHVEGASPIVVKNERESYIRLDGLKNRTTSAIHLFSNNVIFSAKVRANKVPDAGGVWVGVRFNLNDAYVIKCGYDFASSQWIIKDYYNHNLWTHKPVKMGFKPKTWYNLKVTAFRNVITFYLNGKIICQARNIHNSNYGKVILEANGVIADFDDIYYKGTGRPQAGVSSLYFEGMGNADMIRLSNGDLIMQYNGPCRFMRSTDNGTTWLPDKIFTSAQAGWGVGNICRTENGKILHLFQNIINPHPNFLSRTGVEVSSSQGTNWTFLSWIQPKPGSYCTMNGKITRTFRTGRIFWPIGISGEGTQSEDVGGIAIWYSDDQGSTWLESNVKLTKNTTGFNLQEGEVLELPSGQLALIARSDTGYLMYSISDDNGCSWSTNICSTKVPSVMGAFNTMYDPKTKEMFLFWIYDDPLEFPDMPQKPRERISLARSTNDMQNWQFLCDIDDFGGHSLRFMNLGIYVDDEYIYTMASVFGTGIGKKVSRAALQVTRLERSKLTPYNQFPTLH